MPVRGLQKNNHVKNVKHTMAKQTKQSLPTASFAFLVTVRLAVHATLALNVTLTRPNIALASFALESRALRAKGQNKPSENIENTHRRIRRGMRRGMRRMRFVRRSTTAAAAVMRRTCKTTLAKIVQQSFLPPSGVLCKLEPEPEEKSSLPKGVRCTPPPLLLDLCAGCQTKICHTNPKILQSPPTWLLDSDRVG